MRHHQQSSLERGASVWCAAAAALSGLARLLRIVVPVSYIHCSGNWQSFVNSILSLSLIETIHIKACMPNDHLIHLCRGLSRLPHLTDLQIRYPENIEETNFSAMLGSAPRLRRLYVLVDFDLGVQNRLATLITEQHPGIWELLVADGYNCDERLPRQYRTKSELALCLNSHRIPVFAPSVAERMTVLQVYLLDQTGFGTLQADGILALAELLPRLRVFSWRTIMLHDNPVQCTAALLSAFGAVANAERICARTLVKPVPVRVSLRYLQLEMMFAPATDVTPLEAFLSQCTPHLEEIFARLYAYTGAQMRQFCNCLIGTSHATGGPDGTQLAELHTVKLHIERVGDVVLDSIRVDRLATAMRF